MSEATNTASEAPGASGTSGSRLGIPPETADDRPEERPYPGLRPFDRGERYIFFGRDPQINELVDRLGRRRFLAVVGASGCGKSSLVRAGLLDALETGLLVKAGSRWRITTMFPRDRPVWNLAEALLRDGVLVPDGSDDTGPGCAAASYVPDGAAVAMLEGTLSNDKDGLVRVVREARLRPDDNVLVVIDQFEELFRFSKTAGRGGTGNRGLDDCRDEADRFVKLLLAAVAATSKPSIYVAITMRSEYLGDAAMFRGLPEMINDAQFLTPQLTREQRSEAIRFPAEIFGGRVREDLVEQLLYDMGPSLDKNLPSGPLTDDRLPLMQHALSRLWKQAVDRRRSDRDAPELTLQDYRDPVMIGGIRRCLNLHAEDIYRNVLTDRQRALARVLFCCLTERAGGLLVRRPTSLVEVARFFPAAGTVRPPDVAELTALVDVFRDEHLNFLTPRKSVRLEGDTLIDIAHESLIRQWDRLGNWANDDAERGFQYQRFLDAAGQWSVGRSKDYLLRGEPLRGLNDFFRNYNPTDAWKRRYGRDLDYQREADLLSRFIAASERSETYKRRLRLVGMLLTIVAVGGIGYGIYSRHQNRIAEMKNSELKKAIEVRDLKSSMLGIISLAQAAQYEANDSPQRGVLLATQAADKARALLRRFEGPAPDSIAARDFPELGASIQTVDDALRKTLRNIGGIGFGDGNTPLESVAVDPRRGRWASTVDQSGRVRLWILGTAGGPPREHADLNQAKSLGFDMPSPVASADGNWLAWLEDDDQSGRRSVQLWSLANLETRRHWRLSGPRTFHSIAFGNARPGEIGWLLGFDADERTNEPMPDWAHIWRLDDQAETLERTDLKVDSNMLENGVRDPTFGWSFSPDGNWLVLSLHDSRMSVYDLRGEPLPSRPHQSFPSPGPKAANSNVEFLAVGNQVRLVDLHTDATVRLFDVGEKGMTEAGPGPVKLQVLAGNESSKTVAVSRDGRWAIVEARDERGRTHGVLWDLAAPLPLEREGRWTLDRYVELSPGPGPGGLGFDSARIESYFRVSADLRYVLTESRYSPGPFSQAALSSRATSDAAIVVWELDDPRGAATGGVVERPTESRARTGRLRTRFSLPPGGSTSWTISGDGRWVAASGRSDRMVSLWSLASLNNQLAHPDPGPSLIPLRGHENGVGGLAFLGGDGALVSVSRDGTGRRWALDETITPTDPRTYRNADVLGWTRPQVNRAGTRAAMPCLDGKLRVWDFTAPHDLGSVAWDAATDLPPSSLLTLQFSVDGRWLLASGRNPRGARLSARLTDTQKLPLTAESSRTIEVPLAYVESFAASPDNRYFALAGPASSSSNDRPYRPGVVPWSVVVWDRRSGSVAAKLDASPGAEGDSKNPRGAVEVDGDSVAFSPDSLLAVTTHGVFAWKTEGLDKPNAGRHAIPIPRPGPSSPDDDATGYRSIGASARSSDGRWLVLLDQPRRRSGPPFQSLDDGFCVIDLRKSDESNRSRWPTMVRLPDPLYGEGAQGIRLEGWDTFGRWTPVLANGDRVALKFSVQLAPSPTNRPDERPRVNPVAQTSKSVVYVWDLGDGIAPPEAPRAFAAPAAGAVAPSGSLIVPGGVGMDRDARRVVVVDDTGMATVHLLETRKTFRIPSSDPHAGYLGHLLSIDGDWLLSQGKGFLVLWRLAELGPKAVPRRVIRGSSIVAPGVCAVDPDGRWLAVTSEIDNIIWLWDMSTSSIGANLPRRLIGHESPASWLRVAVDASGDARHVTSTSSDGIRTWTIPWSELIDEARPVVSRELSAAERQKVFLPIAKSAE